MSAKLFEFPAVGAVFRETAIFMRTRGLTNIAAAADCLEENPQQWSLARVAAVVGTYKDNFGWICPDELDARAEIADNAPAGMNQPFQLLVELDEHGIHSNGIVWFGAHFV